MNIGYLVETAFLNSTGGIAQIPTCMDSVNRTTDMIYVQMSCNIDASLSDSQITQEPWHVQLYLKLPQSSYGNNSKFITEIDTSLKGNLSVVTLITPMVGTNLNSLFGFT